jgi:hypothetical protein
VCRRFSTCRPREPKVRPVLAHDPIPWSPTAHYSRRSDTKLHTILEFDTRSCCTGPSAQLNHSICNPSSLLGIFVHILSIFHFVFRFVSHPRIKMTEHVNRNKWCMVRREVESHWCMWLSMPNIYQVKWCTMQQLISNATCHVMYHVTCHATSCDTSCNQVTYHITFYVMHHVTHHATHHVTMWCIVWRIIRCIMWHIMWHMCDVRSIMFLISCDGDRIKQHYSFKPFTPPRNFLPACVCSINTISSGRGQVLSIMQKLNSAARHKQWQQLWLNSPTVVVNKNSKEMNCFLACFWRPMSRDQSPPSTARTSLDSRLGRSTHDSWIGVWRRTLSEFRRTPPACLWCSSTAADLPKESRPWEESYSIINS